MRAQKRSRKRTRKKRTEGESTDERAWRNWNVPISSIDRERDLCLGGRLDSDKISVQGRCKSGLCISNELDDLLRFLLCLACCHYFFRSGCFNSEIFNRLRVNRESLSPPREFVRRIAWHFPLAGTFLNRGNRLNRCGFAARRKPERYGDTLSASLCECK